jgi:transketolase
MEEKDLALLANDARQQVVTMLQLAKSGHTAGPLGMADVFTVLYYDWARVDSKNPAWEERDYVYLSNGHICPIWYVTLANKGFFDKDHLKQFRKINSLLQGHPHNETTPGVENSGGPLSQGLSQASGCALALKRDGKKNRVYCLCSDGEHQEGQSWESAMFAAHYKLDNLCCIMDRNNIQIDGFTDQIMNLEPLAAKLKAFGWNVLEIDGHSIKQIKKALEEAGRVEGKPTMILAKTIPGKGVKEFENKYEWHGKPPNDEEAAQALKELKAEREQIQTRWSVW